MQVISVFESVSWSWTDRQLWYWVQIPLVPPNIMPHYSDQLGSATLTIISVGNFYMPKLTQTGTPLVDYCGGVSGFESLCHHQM
jgi:hypothetical protein